MDTATLTILKGKMANIVFIVSIRLDTLWIVLNISDLKLNFHSKPPEIHKMQKQSIPWKPYFYYMKVSEGSKLHGFVNVMYCYAFCFF